MKQRSPLHRRTWNVALRQALATVRELEEAGALFSEQAAVLAFRVAALLRVERATTSELAQHYGVCERTIRNWRRKGAPLQSGTKAMVGWLSARRYLPASTRKLHGASVLLAQVQAAETMGRRERRRFAELLAMLKSEKLR